MKNQIGQLPQIILCTMINTGQYNCRKQTESSEDKVLSRDRKANIPLKMHMFMFMLSWPPSLGYIQCMDHLKFMAYPLRLEHEGGRNADGRRSTFDFI